MYARARTCTNRTLRSHQSINDQVFVYFQIAPFGLIEIFPQMIAARSESKQFNWHRGRSCHGKSGNPARPLPFLPENPLMNASPTSKVESALVIKITIQVVQSSSIAPFLDLFLCSSLPLKFDTNSVPSREKAQATTKKHGFIHLFHPNSLQLLVTLVLVFFFELVLTQQPCQIALLNKSFLYS